MGLGPRPEGDPAGMRALAGQIRGAQGKVGSLPGVRFDGWQSPRAQAARGLVEASSALQGLVTAQLTAAVVTLELEAAELEAEQRRWDRAKEREDQTRAATAAAAAAAALGGGLGGVGGMAGAALAAATSRR